MTPTERRYLLVQTPIGSGVVNAVLNGAIGWAITRGLAEFPLWRVPGVAFDLAATVFGVAFGTCLGSVLQARLDLGAGRATVPRELPPRLASAARRLPPGAMRRGFALGVVAVVLIVPPLFAGLLLVGPPALSVPTFIALKTALSGIEGALVAPLMVLCALLEAQPPTGPDPDPRP